MDDEHLPAGGLGAWLAGLAPALAGAVDADVPCGGCTACCASSQFVHVGPDEHDALAHIPPALRFPAPGLPPGHVVVGYDERGRCPMLTDAGCSIYEHRPRTCRTYDCRVFAATGVAVDAGQPRIAERVRRWRFDVGTAEDAAAGAALRAAAAAVEADDDARRLPAAPRAVLAAEVGAQLRADPGRQAAAVIRVEVRRRRPAEAARPRR